eukprot:13260680-Alexandrium_andersonii.AAC.1
MLFQTCELGSGVRSLNRMGAGTASSLVPEAPEGCSLRRYSRRFRVHRLKSAIEGVGCSEGFSEGVFRGGSEGGLKGLRGGPERGEDPS